MTYKRPIDEAATARARYRQKLGEKRVAVAFGFDIQTRKGVVQPPPPKVLQVLLDIVARQERKLAAHGTRAVRRRRKTVLARTKMARERRTTYKRITLGTF